METHEKVAAIVCGLLIAFFLGIALAATANAHSDDALEAWEADWADRASDGLSPALFDEFRDMRARHACHYTGTHCPPPPATATTRSSSSSTSAGQLSEAQMRALAARYFPAAQVDKAVRVAWCESRWRPAAQNRRSSAGGLFQFLDRTWAQMGGGNKYNADRNTALAAKLWSRAGWSAWSCG